MSSFLIDLKPYWKSTNLTVESVAAACEMLGVAPGTELEIVKLADTANFSADCDCSCGVFRIRMKRHSWAALLHELMHVVQSQRFATRKEFCLAYDAHGAPAFRYSDSDFFRRYMDNPFEVEARAAEERVEELVAILDAKTPTG